MLCSTAMISYLNKDRPPPPRWAKVKARVPVGFLAPFYTLSWPADWALYLLGKWPVVALLQYLGSFPIIFAAAIYFSGAPGRVKQKHYQAWQVINMEEGKGGNGGRIDALEELNRDRISLIGINVAGAYLRGLQLRAAQARGASFASANLRDANFQDAGLSDVDLHYANLRNANLRDCNLSGATLDNADFAGTDLSGANLAATTLNRADFRHANLDHIRNWQNIKSLAKANLLGVRNAPIGFVEWAKQNGAIEDATD